MTSQLDLPLDHLPDWRTCEHPGGFYSLAYVPGGFCCSRCQRLLCQDLPDPPEVVGYLTATWKWKLDGKPWTTPAV